MYDVKNILGSVGGRVSVRKLLEKLGILSLVIVLNGCGAGQLLQGQVSSLGVNPWITANDAFVVKDCTAVFENLARAELNPDMSEEVFSRLIYMRGACHEQQEDLSDAVGSYKYVITKHPHTSASFLAGERLRNLEQQALLNE